MAINNNNLNSIPGFQPRPFEPDRVRGPAPIQQPQQPQTTPSTEEPTPAPQLGLTSTEMLGVDAAASQAAGGLQMQLSSLSPEEQAQIQDRLSAQPNWQITLTHFPLVRLK